MPNEEEEAPQPAPSPASIHVPPGKWHLKVVKGNGQEVDANSADGVEGPLTLTISLVNA